MGAFDWIKNNKDLTANLVSLTFAEKTKFAPLQAADILAYEAGKRFNNQNGPERRALTALNPDKQNLIMKRYDSTNMHVLFDLLEKIKASNPATALQAS